MRSRHGKEAHNRAGQVVTRLHITTTSRLPSLIARARKRAQARMNRLRVNGRIPKLLTKKAVLPPLNLTSADWCQRDTETKEVCRSLEKAGSEKTEAALHKGTPKGKSAALTTRRSAAAVRKAKKAMKK